MRFPNTGTGFEGEETRDFKILNGRSNHEKSCWSATGHAMQPAEILVRGLLQVTTFPTPDEGFELYWEEIAQKHAQACTDALVANPITSRAT